MKKYKTFVKENKEFFTSETDMKNITPEELKLVQSLKDITKKSNVEGSHYIFLKEPVKVGSLDGKDVLCNYFYLHENSFYNEDYLVYHILFDEKPSDLYDKEFDFTLINYGDIKTGVHEIRPYVDGQFQAPVDLHFHFDPNFLEIIYQAASKLDSAWIKKCEDAQKESRDWVRLCNNPEYRNKPLVIDWERQLQHVRSQIFYDKILNNREALPDIKRLKEMEELGETAYKAKQDKQAKLIGKLMKNWKPKE